MEETRKEDDLAGALMPASASMLPLLGSSIPGFLIGSCRAAVVGRRRTSYFSCSPTTCTRSPSPRPRISWWYICSAHGAGCTNEPSLAAHLYTAGQPDPDLLIRTSGELRVSNFLLWQIAYSEIHVTPVLWPDFRREHLEAAINDFQLRQRRFGGL